MKKEARTFTENRTIILCVLATLIGLAIGGVAVAVSNAILDYDITYTEDLAHKVCYLEFGTYALSYGKEVLVCSEIPEKYVIDFD